MKTGIHQNVEEKYKLQQTNICLNKQRKQVIYTNSNQHYVLNMYSNRIRNKINIVKVKIPENMIMACKFCLWCIQG